MKITGDAGIADSNISYRAEPMKTPLVIDPPGFFVGVHVSDDLGPVPTRKNKAQITPDVFGKILNVRMYILPLWIVIALYLSLDPESAKLSFFVLYPRLLLQQWVLALRMFPSVKAAKKVTLPTQNNLERKSMAIIYIKLKSQRIFWLILTPHDKRMMQNNA